MTFTELGIKGTWLIQPKRFGDHRGYFCEVFKQQEFDDHVGAVRFIQDNESASTHGVLRGLHFQKGEWSQAKLVRVSQGRVLDVAVELTADEGNMLFIPRGFAHGFVVLSDFAQFQYKVDNVYAPQAEATLRFDDPALGIDWPLAAEALTLSPKDLKGLPLSEIETFE